MVMPAKIGSVLAALERFVAQQQGRSFFHGAASSEEIRKVKAATGLDLPESYAEFLRRFNGGFISIAGETTDEDWDEQTAAWNSNLLLGTDQIIAKCRELEAMFEEIWDGPWRFLPFCETEGQETLVFAPPDPKTKESPVLDAFHEYPPDLWEQAYPDFPTLLADYVARKGQIETIAGESSDEGDAYRCPVSGCVGSVSWLEEEDPEETSHWFCDVCGSSWYEKKNLLKEIDAIIEKYPYRQACYVKVAGEWQPADEDSEPDDYEDLVEEEPEDPCDEPKRG